MTPDLSYDQEGDKRRAKTIKGMGKQKVSLVEPGTDILRENISDGCVGAV